MTSNEMDFLIESMRMKGIELMPNEEAAIRGLAEVKTLRSALAMFDTSPFVLHSMIRTTTEQFNIFRAPKSSLVIHNNAPDTAGGERKMVQEATGQSVEELQKLLAEATKKKASEAGQSGPKPISLEELQKLLPEATKKATEFEKAETWEPVVGDAIVVRLKRVHVGSYPQPLVVVDEFAGFVDGKLGGSVSWSKKDEKGNVLDKGVVQTPSLVKKDLRLPTFAVSRAMEQDVKLVEKFVYFFQVVGEKATRFPNPYRQVVVISLGPKFPA